jgi:hypothetical protein
MAMRASFDGTHSVLIVKNGTNPALEMFGKTEKDYANLTNCLA